MFARPKPSETEEDLLRLQEEFLKQKQASEHINGASFSDCQNSTNTGVQNKPDSTIDEQLANTFETIPCIPLGAIRERHEGAVNISGPVLQNAPPTGFPKPQKFCGTSRFGRKRKEMQDDSLRKRPSSTVPQPGPERMQVDQPSVSQMKEEIHRQNSDVLASMTIDEVRAEQQKYMNSLDPALIAFIKSRKKAQTEAKQNDPAKMQTTDSEQSEQVNLDEIKIPVEIINEAADNQWVGFDKVEVNKLSWMKDVEVRESIKNKEFEARFDFQGWLLPYKFKDIDESTRALYHHGEDADRPGYTIQELFQLSRSTVIQQRIIALNCIANILQIHSLGIYKDVIDIPVEQIFFVLRFCLDDNTAAVLSASIKAMHNLIFCYTDEVGLDVAFLCGFGKIQPIISIDDKEEDDSTENDQQVIEKNLIKCVVRTNILNRIRYIIESVKPPLEDVHYCLDILIRLARDSKFVYDQIIKCDGLVKTIIESYVPKDSNEFKNVLAEALKLLRVLICRDIHLANSIVHKYHIIQSMEGYLTSELFYSNIEGLKIQIECFNMWSVLLHYRIGCDQFSILQPVLSRLLHYYVNVLDLHQQRSFVVFNHVASFFNFLGQVFAYDHVNNGCYVPLVTLCLRKWTSQFLSTEKSNLIALSALFNCITSYISFSGNTAIIQAVLELISAMLDSERFSTATENIVNDSMLMNECELNTSSANLKTLEAGAWNSIEHVIPVLRLRNCLPLIAAFSNLILATKSELASVKFLNHKYIKLYVQALLTSDKFCNINNWFTRVEGSVIINMLKLPNNIDNFPDWTTTYSLAVKTLPAFNIQQKQDVVYIFSNIIFNPLVLSKVVVSGQNLVPEDMLCSTQDMQKVYMDILDLDKTMLNFDSTLSLDVKIGNIIPVDWLYSPIVALYSKNQECIKISEQTQLYQLKNCLKWILFSENFLPPISDAVGVTEKYCRIACVFLAHDSLFLDPEVHDILQKLLESLMPFSSKIDFAQQIQGVANFEDFYKLLLEQYQGVSYGDKLFGNVILVPLAQRHNVKWRKILWSEYLGTVQSLCITPEQLMFDVATLLEPPEQDTSLVLCYKRALSTKVIRKHSLLYKVAMYHVDSYMQRNKKS